MEENFARVETKYMLTLPQAEILQQGLFRRGFRRMNFGSPRVQSLYYDSSDYRLIRASLERPAYKEKLRLRAYGDSGGLSKGYVEIKKKYNGVVYKRRTAMGLQEVSEALCLGRLPAEAGQVGREASWMLQHYGLVPAAVITYDRDAWFCETDPGVRITFDRNLSFRRRFLDLNACVPGLPLLREDLRLVEIKTNGTCPLWLARLLYEASAQRTHFSKYGLAYRNYILPDSEGSGAKCSTVSFPMGA